MRKTFLPMRWQKQQPDTTAPQPGCSRHSRKESTAAAASPPYVVPEPQRGGIPLQPLEKARMRVADRDRVSSSDDERPMLGARRPRRSCSGQGRGRRGPYAV